MKLDVENVIDLSLKPEDLELEFKWMLFLHRNKFCLQFGETTFLPSFNKMCSKENSSEKLNSWSKYALKSPCYQKLISELQTAFEAWKTAHDVHSTMLTGYYDGNSLEEVQAKLVDKGVAEHFDINAMEAITIE